MGGGGVLSKMYISVTNSNTAIVVMCSSVPWLRLLCALFFCIFLLEYKRTKSSSQTLCRCSCVVCSASGQMYLPFLTAGYDHSRLPWKKWSCPFFSLFWSPFLPIWFLVHPLSMSCCPALVGFVRWLVLLVSSSVLYLGCSAWVLLACYCAHKHANTQCWRRVNVPTFFLIFFVFSPPFIINSLHVRSK